MVLKCYSRLLAVLLFAFLLAGCSQKKPLTIADFTNALQAKGLRIENKNEMLSAMVSARDGIGLDIEGDTIEVYDYDTSIKSGRDALHKYADEGLMGQRTIAHENLLLLANPKHPRWTVIEQVFEGL